MSSGSKLAVSEGERDYAEARRYSVCVDAARILVTAQQDGDKTMSRHRAVESAIEQQQLEDEVGGDPSGVVEIKAESSRAKFSQAVPANGQLDEIARDLYEKFGSIIP